MASAGRDILILMSVYDGQAHLGDQIESLYAQSVAERIHLLIRDDGSTDDSLTVLDKLRTASVPMDVVHGRNVGARASFIDLMRTAPATFPLVMLCDQDDIWLPDKVEAAAKALHDDLGADARPALYAGRSTITDATLHPLGVTDAAPRPTTLRNVLFANIAPGHTMAFNQPLLQLFRDTVNPAAVMHDWWLCLLAVTCGRVVVDPTPHALYRQHLTNEIGYAASFGQRLAQRLRRLVEEDRTLVTRQAKALKDGLGARLGPQDEAFLDAFLNQRRLSDRLRYLRLYPMSSQHGPAIVSSLLYAAGRYRLTSSPRPTAR